MKNNKDKSEKEFKKDFTELHRLITDLAASEEKRNRLEDALFESEERFKAAFEYAPVGMALADTHGRFIKVNKTFCDMLGYSEHELPTAGFRAITHPEDLETVKRQTPHPESGVSGIEKRFIHKTGRIIWAFVKTFTLKDAGGNPLYSIKHIEDITELRQMEDTLRKAKDELENRVKQRTAELMKANEMLQAEIAVRNKAEEELRSLKKAVETVQLGVTIADVNGKILYTNHAEAKMHGYEVEELIGKDVRIFAPAESWNKMPPENLKEVKSYKRESVNVRKDGSVFSVQLLSDALTNADGKLIGIATYCEDITERKRLAEELLKVNKLESVGTLAAGIAHDFNNILTLIIGNISLAKMHANSGDKVPEILAMAEKGCRRAQELTQQLLTFSKGGEPIRKAADISELIKESAGLALSGSMAKVEYYFPDGLWPVDVDEGQINQVINNLILNAEQAIPEGGTIEISAENLSGGAKDGMPLREGKYVKVSVKDNGIGIPAENLHKIFDPYFTTKEKGSGLGLATSYSIVKKHNGYITVESEAGAGTTFYIYLPASEKETPKKKDVEKAAISDNYKIMIMDDEEMLSDSTAKLLGFMGHTVETARDGAEAIELYKKAKEAGHPFDVVIMDLTIPGGMGGREAIKKLRGIDPKVKAVVSSGYSSDSIMADFGNHGFNGVIVKPYRIEELIETLHKVMREA